MDLLKNYERYINRIYLKANNMKTKKQYYALFDNQTGRYLATGMNSTSLNELFKYYSDYKSIDYDDEKDFRHYFNSMSLEDKINFVYSEDFSIEKQDEEFEEEF